MLTAAGGCSRGGSMLMKCAGLAFLLGAFGLAAAVGSPRVSAAPYGTTAAGEPVHGFTIANDRGFTDCLLDYAGAIVEVKAPDRSGRLANVVLAVPDRKTLQANGSLNTLIGRYANRIKGGFTLDGKHHDLPANAKGVTLHGGGAGYN